MPKTAQIGVFGGSGFYEFASSEIEHVRVHTPYGPPSDQVAIATVSGKPVAFLPRHGRNHTIPPHKINFRANLWALRELGVTRIIAPSAVGSLNAQMAPGQFVINDQFVDRTSGRADTFFDGAVVTHVSAAQPYCPQLRQLAIDASRVNDVPVHETGTVVIIQGPRFSSEAESRWFGKMGWDIVNMTQYPEMILARELEMCYVTISLVTDYDAGVVVGNGAHVEARNVLEVLKQNTENVKLVIKTMIETMPPDRSCPCSRSLEFAQM